MEIIIYLICLTVVLTFLALFLNSTNTQEIEELEKAYQASLLGTNKRAALHAGRAYRAALRGKRKLTVYDELAIANDLAAMDLSAPDNLNITIATDNESQTL